MMLRRGRPAAGLRDTYDGAADFEEDDAMSQTSSILSDRTADSRGSGGSGGGGSSTAGESTSSYASRMSAELKEMSPDQFTQLVTMAQNTLPSLIVLSKRLTEDEKKERADLSSEAQAPLENKELQRIKGKLMRQMEREGLTLVMCPWSKKDAKGRTVPVCAWYRRDKVSQSKRLTPDMLYETVMAVTVEEIQSYMASTKRTVPWPEAFIQVVMQRISKDRSVLKPSVTFAAAKYEAKKNKDGSLGPETLVLPGDYTQPEQPTPAIRSLIQQYYNVLKPLTQLQEKYRERRKQLKRGDESKNLLNESRAKMVMDVFMEANGLALTDPIPVYMSRDDEEPIPFIIERTVTKPRARTTLSVKDCKSTLHGVMHEYLSEFRRNLKNMRRAQPDMDPSIARFNDIDTLQLRMFIKNFRTGLVESLKLRLSTPPEPRVNIRARPMTEKDQLRLRRGEEALEQAAENARERSKRSSRELRPSRSSRERSSSKKRRSSSKRTSGTKPRARRTRRESAAGAAGAAAGGGASVVPKRTVRRARRTGSPDDVPSQPQPQQDATTRGRVRRQPQAAKTAKKRQKT